MIGKFGRTIVDSRGNRRPRRRDMKNMAFKGILPSGGELWLNSLVDWADLIVSDGFIEPHFFAGFSGGRKSILPGIASEKTVFANHCSQSSRTKTRRRGTFPQTPSIRIWCSRPAPRGLPLF
jgi:nickel-dependent lactate racemase